MAEQYVCTWRRALLLPVLAAGMACARPAPEESVQTSSGQPAAGAQATVLPGIDVLLAEGAQPLRGLRTGLITNHTGLTADGRSTIDALHAHPDVNLVALFGPEHGLRGTAGAGERVEEGRDERTGLPVRSLYGETRSPTAEMLRDVDALVFDIQDVGTRYYTYVWTMALSMQAAAENGKKFVVLDRPNPIGGRLVQGNVQDTTRLTFVGLYPVPMRHGLTVGEMARLINERFGINAQLTVVPAGGWRRDVWYDRTGLPWVAPSPNMPDLESATHYPGICLFEGTNLSVGRGTPRAFQHIGAPWLDAPQLARRLNARGLPGVAFEPVVFTPVQPGDGKFADQEIPGVRFVATDRDVYDPTRAAIAALIEIRALHADRLDFAEAHFDRLAGTDRVRLRVLDGAGLEEVTRGWAEQTAAFEALRRPYLLYE